MKASIHIDKWVLHIDLDKGFDISMPVSSNPLATKAWYCPSPVCKCDACCVLCMVLKLFHVFVLEDLDSELCVIDLLQERLECVTNKVPTAGGSAAWASGLSVWKIASPYLQAQSQWHSPLKQPFTQAGACLGTRSEPQPICR